MDKKINEIKRKSVSGVISYTIRTVLLYLVAIGATGILSAYLDPHEFGIYFIVTSVISIFTFLSDIGLAAALVQKREQPSVDELRTTFTVQQILALTILGLIFLLTPLWRSQIGLDKLGMELLYALGLSFVLASLKTIPSILLERELEFNKLVLPQVLENLVFYGTAVTLAISGLGIRSYTLAVLLRSVTGVLAIYWLKRWPLGFSISKPALKNLIGFGAKFQINDFLARLKDDLFVVVLAKFLPASDMGYIGWAKRWSMFPYQFSVNSVVAITFPTFSRLQHDTVLLRKAVEKSLFFITLLIFPILGGMALMALPLTDLIPAYQKWQPALPSLYFFCFNIAWAAVSTPLTNTLNAIGKINKTLKLMIMWTALTWGLTPPALYFFGFTGVAIVSAIVGVTSIVTVLMVKKVMDFSFIEQVWRQVLATAVMMVVLGYLSDRWSHGFGNFSLGVLTGILTYAAILMAIGSKKLYTEVHSLLKKS